MQLERVAISEVFQARAGYYLPLTVASLATSAVNPYTTLYYTVQVAVFIPMRIHVAWYLY